MNVLDIRDKKLRETAISYRNKLGGYMSLFSDALIYAFNPWETKEGVDFWVAVNKGEIKTYEEGIKYINKTK